jgi:dTDP-4-dehydrorhamnose 3,5-epimerase
MSHIEGVNVIPLKKIPDERGTIYHMLRSSDPHFTKFGEIYFSKIYKGAIKGWHIHKRVSLNYCVVMGMVKLVLFDMREDSPTNGNLMELFIGDDNYCLVQIPVGVANGHKGMTETALLANAPDIPHDKGGPDEMIKIDPYNNNIPYNWDRVDQ